MSEAPPSQTLYVGQLLLPGTPLQIAHIESADCSGTSGSDCRVCESESMSYQTVSPSLMQKCESLYVLVIVCSGIICRQPDPASSLGPNITKDLEHGCSVMLLCICVHKHRATVKTGSKAGLRESHHVLSLLSESSHCLNCGGSSYLWDSGLYWVEQCPPHPHTPNPSSSQDLRI